MSYTTGTTHYNLPQTVGSDKRDWFDTNEAFAEVDTALYGAVQDTAQAGLDISALQSDVSTINGKLSTDEGNITTLQGKVSSLESTVASQGTELGDVRRDLQDNIESNHEATATSTHAYSVGDYFFYNDVLYKATAIIGVGDTIVPNTNCTGVTVMTEMENLAPGTVTASDVSYDNTTSGLTADDVQEAIDEVVGMIPGGGETATFSVSASDTYGALVTAITTAIDLSKVTAKTVIKVGERVYYVVNVTGRFCFMVDTSATPNFSLQSINLVQSEYTVNGSNYNSQTISPEMVGTGTIYY